MKFWQIWHIRVYPKVSMITQGGTWEQLVNLKKKQSEKIADLEHPTNSVKPPCAQLFIFTQLY